MYIRVKKKWQHVFDICMIILGSFIAGFSFSVFMEPNHITVGGFSGISMMLSSLFSRIGAGFLTSSIIYFVLNFILFIIAFRYMGKIFALKAFVGFASFAGAMEIFALIPQFVNFDLIVSALFGGATMGFGVGTMVRFGGSSGGSDMVACMVRKKKPNFHIGRIVLCIDVAVVSMTLFVFKNGLELLPYTLIILVTSTLVTDFVIEGYKQVRAFHIITNKGDEIEEKIKLVLVRGCTVSKVRGSFNKNEKECVLCLIEKYQIETLKQIVAEIDPEAFVYSTSVTEVVGLWNDNQTIRDKNEQDNITFSKKKKKVDVNEKKVCEPSDVVVVKSTSSKKIKVKKDLKDEQTDLEPQKKKRTTKKA